MGGGAAEHYNGSFRALHLTHDLGLHFAICPTLVPAGNEQVVMSLGATMGASMQAGLSATGSRMVDVTHLVKGKMVATTGVSITGGRGGYPKGGAQLGLVSDRDLVPSCVGIWRGRPGLADA